MWILRQTMLGTCYIYCSISQSFLSIYFLIFLDILCCSNNIKNSGLVLASSVVGNIAALNPFLMIIYFNCINFFFEVLNSHDYVLKVVPSLVEDIQGNRLLNPYQYTYAHRVSSLPYICPLPLVFSLWSFCLLCHTRTWRVYKNKEFYREPIKLIFILKSLDLWWCGDLGFLFWGHFKTGQCCSQSAAVGMKMSVTVDPASISFVL